MKKETLRIAICATIIALTVALGWLPYVFLIPMLFAACCFGYSMSFFASATFGIVSLVFAMMYGGSTPVSYFFIQYPWVPIVPRLLVGPIAHSVYLLMKKLLRINDESSLAKKIPAISITAILGSLSNTVLVGLCIYFTGQWNAVEGLAYINLVIAGSIEMAVTAVLLPAIVLTVQKAVPQIFGIKPRAAKKDKLKDEKPLQGNDL